MAAAKVREQLAEARELLAHAASLLDDIEFAGLDGMLQQTMCPVCGSPEYIGRHEDRCDLIKLIAEIEEFLK